MNLLIGLLSLSLYGEPMFNPWYVPSRYDHPFKGRVEVEMNNAPCSGMEGCTIVGGQHGVCHIYVSPTHKLPIELILRHERAHCNGWPADHPF